MRLSDEEYSKRLDQRRINVEEEILTKEEQLLTDCLYLSGMETTTVLWIMASLPTLKAVRKVLWLTANENIELNRDLLYETAVRIMKEED